MTHIRSGLARAATLIASILFWAWVTLKAVVSSIGATTVGDDFEQMIERLPKWADWLFSTPWWVPACLALTLTVFLIWLAWPSNELKQAPPDVDQNREQRQPSVQIINPLETYFSKKILRLADMIYGDSYIIEDKIFEDCIIYGPAVIYFVGGKQLRMEGCHFSGTLESTLIEIKTGRYATGIIGLSGGALIRCKLVGVSIVGSKETLESISKGFI